MPVDELRQAVKGLMPRAKDDLAELVAFKSVADAKQFPPESTAADHAGPVPLFWPGPVPRNLAFLAAVLAHALRRLLPPY